MSSLFRLLSVSNQVIHVEDGAFAWDKEEKPTLSKYVTLCCTLSIGCNLKIPYFRPDSQNVYPISDPVLCCNFGN